MGEASKYSLFLEYASIAVVALALLGHVELITAQDYNVGIGLFLIYCAYSQNGRTNAVGAVFVLFSLMIDIIIMSRFGEAFQLTGTGKFGLAMLVLVFLVKIGIVALHYFLYNEFGGTSFPAARGLLGSRGGDSSYEGAGFTSDQSHLSDVHYQVGPTEPIGSTYQQAADASSAATTGGGYPAAPTTADTSAKY